MMIFQNGKCQMCCRPRKNKKIIWQKLRENGENLAIFTIILMATFGTKNINSALLFVLPCVCNAIITYHQVVRVIHQVSIV